jgi:hypothetical protein
MRATALLGLLGALCLAACVQPAGVSGTGSLGQQWMFGIERMRGDPLPQLPYTNRFLADLAGMPNVQVVYLGAPENAALFASWSGGRLRVSPWLRGETWGGGLSCMNVTYTIVQSGQPQGNFGLVIPPPAAGTESDPACVDRAAGAFYQTLVVQGL